MPDDRVILAIETSNPGAAPPDDARAGPGVSLLRRGRVLAHAPITPRQRHDDALLPAIDGACREAGVTPSDLGLVGVSIGPGGYTAVRIGVTVAKTIAEATGCACVGVPTALAVVYAIGASGPTLVALAWKRDDVWIQPFAGDEPENNGRIVKIAALPELAAGRTLVAEHRLLEQVEYAGAHTPPVFSARAIGELAPGITPVDPAGLLPLYPREPEAVRKWNALRR